MRKNKLKTLKKVKEKLKKSRISIIKLGLVSSKKIKEWVDRRLPKKKKERENKIVGKIKNSGTVNYK